MSATRPEGALSDEQLAEVIARRGPSGGSAGAARAAFEQLYHRHARLLLAFLAGRAGRNDVDDIHQEVWQRVWHRLPDAFRGGDFRAWLYQIARNALIDLGRKKRPEALGDDEALADARVSLPVERLLEQERAEILRRCLERLGPEAAALVRARLGGDSYPEICRRLSMKPERAHKLFHLAKDQLQTCVERASA